MSDVFVVPAVTRAEVVAAMASVWDHLGRPGANFDGEQRLGIAAVTRLAAPRPLWDRPPELAEIGDRTLVAAVAERLAVAAGTVDAATASEAVDRLGDAAYAEIAAIVTQVVAIDRFHRVLGLRPPELPEAVAGDATGVRPDDLADGGGHVPMVDGVVGRNVARSLSLAGADNDRRRVLVAAMYAGSTFDDMVWNDRTLSRPQVELLAARTSVLNECFY